MERIVHKSHDHKDAEKWDIQQQRDMTPNERMRVAKQLIDQYYGTDVPDVRESGVWKKRLGVQKTKMITCTSKGSWSHNETALWGFPLPKSGKPSEYLWGIG